MIPEANHMPILENESVRLRALEESDFHLLLPFAENEPELWTYSLLPADGAKNLRTYVRLALLDAEKGYALPFIVFDKRTHQWVGSTRFYDLQPNHATTQLGYTWYGKQFQGTGLNKNVKFLLLEFAFEVMQMQRVEFRADARNQQSIAAMKSIGCTEEGILRSNCDSPSGRRDSIVLSILRTEWETNLKSQLLKQISIL